MKILLGYLSLTILILIILSTPVHAVCCKSNLDCTVPGEYCRFGTPDATQCANNFPSTPGFCELPDPLNPDIKIPNYASVPELGQNFNFNIFTGKLTDIGIVLNSALQYVFAIAGLLLFFYLVYGAITMLSGFGNPEKLAAGNTIITRALIGFAIIFISYWLTQILEIIFDITILGT